MIYGCHALRRGDRDGDPAQNRPPVWGGQQGAAPWICPQPQPAAPVNPQGAVNNLAIPEHVRALQEDLRTLGFLVVGTPDGGFGRQTAWAVREFQVYARMAQVARVRANAPANAQQGAHLVAALGQMQGALRSVYVDSLEQVANGAVYQGPISGVVNAQTRDALEHWLQNDYRCPVVIEAWSVQGGNRTALVAGGVNVWLHDGLPNAAPRFFARDFTDYYVLPAGRNANDMHVIGDFASYLTWSGPRSTPPGHTWREGEMLPLAMTGNANPTGAALSTYRVVRAVSEVECIGFFDSVNCYDNAFVSVGPCHWTLGIVPQGAGPTSEGEMCGYLAYLRAVDNAAFVRAFENFGARIDESWTSTAGVNDGSAMFSRIQRKYHGWVALQDDQGAYLRLAQSEAEGNYFKTWHWHYRFVMAGRTIDGYRRRMWDMGRMRIRDFRSVVWGPGLAAVVTNAQAAPPQTRPATLGDVFTSEKGAALVLRMHIRAPGNVVTSSSVPPPLHPVASAYLQGVLANAQAATPNLPWNTDPSGWTDAHEAALLQEILANPPNNVGTSLNTVDQWPSWLVGSNPRGYQLTAPVASPLATTRGSLSFDTAGLPPAP